MIHFNHLECVGDECVRKGEGELCEGGGVVGCWGMEIFCVLVLI